MADLANVLTAVLSSAVVQTTAVFTVGLLIARCLVRQPARAHAVLALTFVAAVAVPLASHVVRLGGWGLLVPQGTPTLARAAETVQPAAGEIVPQSLLPDHRLADGRIEDAPRNDVAKDHPTNNRGRELAAWDAQARPVTSPRKVAVDAVASSWLPAAAILGFCALVLAWPIATAIAAARLFGGALAGRRLLAAAIECREPAVTAALAVARRRLELETARIDVYQLDQLHCPIIWCWSSYPRIILPRVAASRWTAAEWAPILCHELAHWKRRDHYSALIAEIVCCLIPWQPLAWWSKRRLEHASEQACDDWAVAAGHSATEYAEALLGLVAQSDPPLALAVLRRSSGLASRVRHVLTQRVPRPRLGRAWAVAALTVTVAGVTAAALSQRGVAREEPGAPLPAADPGAPRSAAAAGQQPPAAKAARAQPAPAMAGRSPKGPTPTGVFVAGAKMPPGSVATYSAGGNDADHSRQPKRHKVTGRVLNPDGQPMPGADVIWEAILRPARTNVRWPAPQEFARAKTDADGRFELEAAVPYNATKHNLVIRAVGQAVRGYLLPLNDEPIEVRFEPTYSIEGAVLTPDGAPVKGARVVVRMISCYPVEKSPSQYKGESWQVWLNDEELKAGKSRDYWPLPAVTDADGRFRFDNLVQQSATAELYVFAEGFPVARAYVAGPQSHRWPEETIAWREPTFTLVLEEPLLVEGRFLDEKTGQPIKGVRVEVMPYTNRGYGNGIEQIEAASDHDGRYTVRAGSADWYFVKIFPPPGYPGHNYSLETRQLELARRAGGKIYYELKLRPGMMLRGRVVDADGGRPVAGAEVVYQPLKGRKLGPNDEFRPVTTAADGTFELTGADGKGFLLVDAPDQGFYRLAVKDSRIPYYNEGIYPHGLVEINVPAAGQKEPVEIALHRGPALVGRAIDPSGKPLTAFVAACVGRQLDGYLSNEQCTDGFFRLDSVEPGRKYRVYLYSQEANAGATAELVAPPDGGVVDVQLEPCGTIRGRYIYEGGAPVPEITNFTKFRVNPEEEPANEDARNNMPWYGNFASGHDKSRTTDADGRFELGGIVPGAFIYLGLNFQFAADGENLHAVGVLKPGEVKDVGELVLRRD